MGPSLYGGAFSPPVQPGVPSFMSNKHFYACILAGGSGERFWPMSRARLPKHLLRLISERTLA